MLSRGSSGKNVKVLQSKLVEKGYSLIIDGSFGRKVTVAVKDLQSKNGLVSDGIVGPATWGLLKSQSEFLKNNSLLMPSNPAAKNPKALEGNSLDKLLLRIYNSSVGIAGPLAQKLDIDPCIIYAVIAVEAAGRAFSDHGLIIRFENHVMARQPKVDPRWFKERFTYSASKPWTGHKFKSPGGAWTRSHIWPKTDSVNGNQAREWQSFNIASEHDYTAAVSSISMGLPQMMGFNYHLIGYSSPEEMFKAFSKSYNAQLLGMFDFIIGVEPKSKMLDALRIKDFVKFAKSYNGSGKAQEYGSLIERHFNRAKELKLG